MSLSNQLDFGVFFKETDEMGFEMCIFWSGIYSSNELRKGIKKNRHKTADPVENFNVFCPNSQ